MTPNPTVGRRRIPEGAVPLIAVEGSARDCGRQYAEIVMEKYPGYRRYLDAANEFMNLAGQAKKLLEARAPHVIDLHRGLMEVAGPPSASQDSPTETACTSFGVARSATLDGEPISGQTKDTVIQSASLYVVLRMRITGAPTILTLAYPGEILGYGFWSTGMSLFRNALHAKPNTGSGLTMGQWAFLTLAADTVEEGVELGRKFGLAGAGNCLISDRCGHSVSVEFNAGGVNIVPAKDGIATHANHPQAAKTAPFEDYPEEKVRDSRYRSGRLWKLLHAEAGRLTAQKALMALADHSAYPAGICRHLLGSETDVCTTAAIVAEPTRGKLHVTRGPACSNWPATYTL